ncbi:uncharacterized protein LOC117645856 [Thrips palmi]|uniref:Uncharacterized protein LOC117645856 n=1 Tax=Thrips palmi TaxID=161013 RepID=A0A6P8YQJ5_THRPL|nr:uncharacterized protein LOC117645856 [Thrips palmi]
MASRKEWPSRPPLSPPSPFREVEVMKNTSFCELVRPSLYFLRMFGVMPVDLRDGSFRWATFRTAHCFLAVVVFLRAAVRWTIRILTPNDSNKATGAAVTGTLLETSLFLLGPGAGSQLSFSLWVLQPRYFFARE